MIKKQVLKSKPECKVTFSLDKKHAQGAQKVNLVGEFNNWSETETEMTPLKSGGFKAVMSLPVGRDYQFRYLIDGKTWINDENADTYVDSGIAGEENGVVSL